MTHMTVRHTDRGVGLPLMLLLCAALLMTGCATNSRTPFTEQEAAIAQPVGLPGIRFWVDTPGAMFRSRVPGVTTAHFSPRSKNLVWLALSGGAEYGAYGAGVLAGWTAAGTRPQFSVVSGVSTGALIAPFAFLGPQYDQQLTDFYTKTPPSALYRSKGLFGLFGPSLLDESPLRALVAQAIDDQFMAEIAREHRKGRRLYVITTHLDAERGVVWDMGAIATSGAPNARKLFHDVLIASASQPGLFPPVYVEAEANGRKFKEMHVDGAVGEQVFTPAGAVSLAREYIKAEGTQANRLYILANNKLQPEFDVIDPSVVTITQRSFATLGKRSLNADVQRAYAGAQRGGIDFNLSSIPPTYSDKLEEPFDLKFRQRLFSYGFDRAAKGAAWAKQPPGLGS